MSVKSSARAIVDYVAVHGRLLHGPADALGFVGRLAELVESLHLELAMDADRDELVSDMRALRSSAAGLATYFHVEVAHWMIRDGQRGVGRAGDSQFGVM